MREKKVQKAGDNSTQLNAGRDIRIRYQGVTAATVTEISRLVAKQEVQEAVLNVIPEVVELVNKRVDSLVNGLAEKFKDDKEKLAEAFKDPAFYFLWQEAAHAAAASGEEDVEKLLVDLIENRVNKKSSNRTNLITSQAIASASQLSKEAKDCLTATWITLRVVKISHKENYSFQLERIKEYWKTIVNNCDLPKNSMWIEELELLKLARVHGGFNTEIQRYETFWHSRFKRFTCRGFDQSGFDQYVVPLRKIDEKITKFISPHPLRDGFYFINAEDKAEIFSVVGKACADSQELKELLGLSGFGGSDGTPEARLTEIFREDSDFLALEEWWNTYMKPIELTSVGEVIGFSSAKRFMNFQEGVNLNTLILDIV